jgi:hypothetical protein
MIQTGIRRRRDDLGQSPIEIQQDCDSPGGGHSFLNFRQSIA